MNRLQKKCLIAMAGLHLLLVLVLLFGSAFFTHHEKPDDTQLLDVIPANLIDAAFNSGVKNAQAPAPTPPQPPTPPKAVVTPSTPPPQPAPTPTLMQRVEKIFTPEPKQLTPDEPTEPATKPKEQKIKVDLKTVKRNTPKVTPDTSEADDARTAKQARDRAKSAVARALSNIKNNATDATEIDMPSNSSASYANYGAAVVSIYHQAWTPPDSMISDSAVVRFTVTIARNGSVISSRIVTSSGDRSVDNAVQRMLDRVSFIQEFPEGTKDRQRTYNIDFNATRTTSQ